MRLLPILSFVLGLVLLLSNVRDEIRGETRFSFGWRGSPAARHGAATKAIPETDFRGSMGRNWFAAAALLGFGGFALSLWRHYGRHDLLSIHFKSTGEEKNVNHPPEVG